VLGHPLVNVLAASFKVLEQRGQEEQAALSFDNIQIRCRWHRVSELQHHFPSSFHFAESRCKKSCSGQCGSSQTSLSFPASLRATPKKEQAGTRSVQEDVPREVAIRRTDVMQNRRFGCRTAPPGDGVCFGPPPGGQLPGGRAGHGVRAHAYRLGAGLVLRLLPQLL